MEIAVFFAFIAVCALALLWASRKSNSEAELTRKQRLARNSVRAEKLMSPRDSLLAHKDEVWQNRRKHATVGVTATNQFVPRSETIDAPEYDGYSRRDRHHVRERTAKVKEDRPEELLMTAVRVRSDEEKASKKAAS
ncbi:MAG: hypothetical protein V2I48_06890 [Xanthomonadales bacterium]|jgi:hypothetical protein|nr:hypothetical protein [Xanthomonadales bacterium]